MRGNLSPWPYYGPSYYYYYPPPPAVVYQAPVVTTVQVPAGYWYYCPAARMYFPYVQECAGGWQAVPAQGAALSHASQPGAEAPPAPAGKVVYRLGDVLFATGKAELRPQARQTLDAMIASIGKEPSRRIVVEGHTDNTGHADFNRELSRRRAEAVRDYLIAHGAPADRISAVGKGEAAPIARNDTAAGRSQNRRVDVVVD
ncbi:MAG: OmpA family protein [Nevskia sp.]|nr:OmpA family protein [Nevskia sp.]